MKKIGDGIFYETGFAGVTLGAIIRQRGILMIDTPLLAEDLRAWKAALLAQNHGTHHMIILLDAHLDRTLCGSKSPYPVIAHTQVMEEIANNKPPQQRSQSNDTGACWETLGNINRQHKPEICFSEALSLHWSGLDVYIEHHPGPAPGASWVHIPEAKVLFIGDAVLPNQPPFLEKADLEAWHETLNYLASRKFYDYTIVSGRDEIITIEEVRAFREYLRSIRGRMETLANRGGQAEETEKFIQPLLEKIAFPASKQEQFAQRLKYGLFHYYQRHYRQDA
ncbi:MAG: MBL fold metallo-hydrolase [Anaerolineae bacterium]|nr:MAG: MBL fold metallo-hydrolase [Anaerolineae bacterium]